MATEPRPLPPRDRSTVQQAALSTAGPSSVVPLKTDSDIRRIGLVYLSLLALIVGVVTGFGAVGFRDLIGLIHNVLFLGKWAVRYDANLFTPASPWGSFVILVPVLGGVAVTFLVNTFAPEARGLLTFLRRDFLSLGLLCALAVVLGVQLHHAIVESLFESQA